MMNRFCESRREQFKSVLNGHQCRWMVRWMWKNVVYEKFHKVIYNRMGTTYRNRVSSTSNTFRDSFASQLFLFSSSKIHSLPANHLDKLVGQVFTASADSGKVFSNEDSLSLSLSPFDGVWRPISLGSHGRNMYTFQSWGKITSL